MNQQKIGKFIQEKRKKKELSQMELAEKLGVSNRTISKWENGNSMPDYSIITCLCKELDITINELLSGENLTEENYQKKLEENFVSTIDYNNKKRNKKIIRIIVILVFFIFLRVLYKMFILSYYDERIVFDDYSRTYPYNQNIFEHTIHSNQKANMIYDDYGTFQFYLPDGFELVSDKEKSYLVNDSCDLYLKNQTSKEEFDAAIFVCYNIDSIHNLEQYDIRDTYFPFFITNQVLEKYDIHNTMDLVEYWGNHYDDQYNVFTSSDKIKMKHIARQYTISNLSNYDNLYFLNGDYTGYLREIYPNGKNMGNYSWGKGSYHLTLYLDRDLQTSYSISFHNKNNEYFNYDNVMEIVDSILDKE